MINQQNLFAQWADMNKQLIDTWGSWVSDSVLSAPGDMDKVAKQWSKNWMDGMKSMSSFIPSSAAKDGFDRFMNSFQLFSGLQSYWDKMLKNLPTDMAGWDPFSESFMDQYKEFSSSFAGYLMPDQLKNMFTDPIETFTSLQDTFMQNSVIQFFRPWIDNSTTLSGLLMRAMQGDVSSYQEFLNEWEKLYTETTGKILNVPMMGSNSAQVEKMMKFLDTYVKFVVVQKEFSVLITDIMSGSMDKLFKRLGVLYAEGNFPQTFMEFFTLWSRFHEQSFTELYATDEFSKVMNQVVSLGSKLKILIDEFMQDILSILPLPNMQQLDEVSREVYELRKRVHTLEKEMKAVKTMLNERN